LSVLSSIYLIALLLLKWRAQLLSFLYSRAEPLPFSTTGGFAASSTALQQRAAFIHH